MMKRLSLYSFCLIVLTARISLAAVVVPGDPADGVIFPDGSVSQGPRAGRIGSASTSPAGSRVGVFVFALPAQPAASSYDVISASFTFNVVSIAGPRTYNLDLYGIEARAEPKVLGGQLENMTITDHFVGSYDEDAHLILDNAIPAEFASTGLVTVSNEALRSYIATQYGPSGENAGKYVFLRLNPDIDTFSNDNSGINVSFTNSTAGDPPYLTLEFASLPEPGMLVVFAIFAVAFIRQRN